MSLIIRYSDFDTFNEASKEAQEYISKKIKKLTKDEGMPQKQAVAVALNYAKKKGYKIPSKKNESEEFLINEHKLSKYKLKNIYSKFKSLQENLNIAMELVETYENVDSPDDLIQSSHYLSEIIMSSKVLVKTMIEEAEKHTDLDERQKNNIAQIKNTI